MHPHEAMQAHRRSAKIAVKIVFTMEVVIAGQHIIQQKMDMMKTIIIIMMAITFTIVDGL